MRRQLLERLVGRREHGERPVAPRGPRRARRPGPRPAASRTCPAFLATSSRPSWPGVSTRSITWITPFRQRTSALITVASLTATPRSLATIVRVLPSDRLRLRLAPEVAGQDAAGDDVILEHVRELRLVLGRNSSASVPLPSFGERLVGRREHGERPVSPQGVVQPRHYQGPGQHAELLERRRPAHHAELPGRVVGLVGGPRRGRGASGRARRIGPLGRRGRPGDRHHPATSFQVSIIGRSSHSGPRPRAGGPGILRRRSSSRCPTGLSRDTARGIHRSGKSRTRPDQGAATTLGSRPASTARTMISAAIGRPRLFESRTRS